MLTRLKYEFYIIIHNKMGSCLEMESDAIVPIVQK